MEICCQKVPSGKKFFHILFKKFMEFQSGRGGGLAKMGGPHLAPSVTRTRTISAPLGTVYGDAALRGAFLCTG